MRWTMIAIQNRSSLQRYPSQKNTSNRVVGVRQPGHTAPSRYTVKNGAQQTMKHPTITPTVFAAFVSRFSDLSCAGMKAMWSLENGEERACRLTWLPASASMDWTRRMSCDEAWPRLGVAAASLSGCSSVVTTIRGRLKSLVAENEV